jgi:hypothetical protein
MADTKPETKKFGKGERSIPHHTQKASKYYPAVDVAVAKKVRYRRRQEARERKLFSVTLRRPLHTRTVVWQIRSSHLLAQPNSGETTHLTITPGPQNSPPSKAQRVPHTWHRCHPPCWSLPRQACRSPQTPTPGCPSRHRPFQSQWRSPAKGKRSLCHCHIDQGGYRGNR